MDKCFVLLVFLANVLLLKCQEEEQLLTEEPPTSTGNPNYSFSYGVADASTRDVKAVWEQKDGDTVQGHYSVLEPDGTMRTVEYSANPKTGFQAVVHNDGEKVDEVSENVDQGIGIGRAMRDYEKYYDFNDVPEFDAYTPFDKKKNKYPFDTVFKDYSRKKPKYPSDLESSEFTHSVTIKHPRDETGAHSESHAHFGLDLDPHCKHKHKHATASNSMFTNVGDELRYPIPALDPFKSDFEKYEKYEPSNAEFDKVYPFNQGKLPKLEAPSVNYDKLLRPFSAEHLPSLEEFKAKYKYPYPYIPDIPMPENLYPDDYPIRPKKKHRPHKNHEYKHSSEDERDDYWVPKKKKKTPPRYEPDYYPEADEDFERPHRYQSDDDDDDERPRKPLKEKPPKTEVVKKIIKKRKPGFNLLDILDI